MAGLPHREREGSVADDLQNQVSHAGERSTRVGLAASAARSRRRDVQDLAQEAWTCEDIPVVHCTYRSITSWPVRWTSAS